MKPVFVKKSDVGRVLGVHRHAVDRMIEAGAIRPAPRLRRYVFREDVERTFDVVWPEGGGQRSDGGEV